VSEAAAAAAAATAGDGLTKTRGNDRTEGAPLASAATVRGLHGGGGAWWLIDGGLWRTATGASSTPVEL